MRHLMIRNPGLCPVEGFTVMGVSSTREHGNDDTIGRFGTGLKQAIALFLRNNISPTVFIGNLRLSFSVEDNTFDDGLSQTYYGRIVVHYSGKDANGKSVNRKEKLGYSTEMGVHDWTKIDMAMRELIANAHDRATRQTGSWKNAEVKEVDMSSVRAKSDYTAVYVPMTPDVMEYVRNLPKRFLHYGNEENLNKEVLPKAPIEKENPPIVFKQGVYVRQSEDFRPSVFNYNLKNLDLDESRTVDDYAITQVAAAAIRDASTEQLMLLFSNFAQKRPVWEESFSFYYMKSKDYGMDAEKYEGRCKTWQDAWNIVGGEHGIICSEEEYGMFADTAQKKGYNPVVIKDQDWRQAMAHYGIRGIDVILSPEEREGWTAIEPTPEAIAALDTVWSWFVRRDLTRGKEKPSVVCFRPIMDGGAQTFGLHFMRDNKVYVHTDLASGGGQCIALQSTMLEELTHYVTGSHDHSRDLQDFLFRWVTEVEAKIDKGES